MKSPQPGSGKNSWPKRELRPRCTSPGPAGALCPPRLSGSGEKKTAHSAPPYGRGCRPRPSTGDLEPFSGPDRRRPRPTAGGALDCKGTAVVQFSGPGPAQAPCHWSSNATLFFWAPATKKPAASTGRAGFLDTHFDRIQDAEFVLTEGGGIRRDGEDISYTVSVAEKSPCWIRLTATGPSRPRLGAATR